MSDTAKPSNDPKALNNGLGLEKMLEPVKPSSTKVEQADAKAPSEPKGESKADTKAGAKVDAKGDTKDTKDEKPVDLATMSKQLKDTRDYATKVNKENGELKRSYSALAAEVETLKKKLDGTYVEPHTTPEQQTEIERFKARVEVDNAAVVEQYGADVVQKLIWDADSPYMQLEISDPSIAQRMRAAKRPVMEAMRIVEQHQFFEKYGHDPAAIREAIIAEARQELEAEIKGAMKGKPIESIQSLSKVSAVPRADAPKPHSADVDLNKAFPLFARTFN